MTASTLRRVTPTAVRILPADADRATWLYERRHGIGSSDVAAILGASDFTTAYHVWLDKRGELDDQAGEAALWGTLLEDVVAREWQRRNRSVITRVGLVAHHERNWMRATLDRRVGECPLVRDRSVFDKPHTEHCALEIKCRSAFKANRWHADVPDDVLAQTTWQMAVTGYDHIHVAVLIGGNDYRQTTVRRDEQMETFVVEQAAQFWQINVQGGRMPEWDMTKAEALNELDAIRHPDRAGDVQLDGIEAVLAYAVASAAKSRAEKELKVARAELARLADGRRYATFGDVTAFEFRPVTKSSVDLAALAERHPDAYADCVTEKTHYQLAISPTFRAIGADDDQ